MKATFYILLFIGIFTPTMLKSQNINKDDELLQYFFKSAEYHDEQALFWAKKAEAIQKEFFKDHELAKLLVSTCLGVAYFRNEDYYSALNYLQVAERLLREKPELISSLFGNVIINDLAETYRTLGINEKAEPLYIEALDLIENGKENPIYPSVLNNLAYFYSLTGKYNQAEKLYLEVISLNEKKGIFKDSSYNNLGMMYFKLGNYEKAKLWYNRAIEYIDTLSMRMEYANVLNNIGYVYNFEDNYLTAEVFYKRALNLFNDSEKESLDYFGILINLYALQSEQGLYDEAEYNLNNIMEKSCKTFGEDSPVCLSSLGALSGLYLLTGKYDLVELLLKDDLKKNKDLSGENHPDYLYTLASLGAFYNYIGKPELGEPFLFEAYKKFKDNLNSIFNFLTEPEQNNYWKNKVKDLFELFYPSFLYNLYLLKKEEAASYLYDNTLFVKNLLLSRMSYIHDFFLKEGNNYCLNLWNELTMIKHQLNILYRKPLEQQHGKLELEDKANRIEKELMEKSSEYKTFKGRSEISWKNISERLKNDEVAIEFINFRYHNYKEGKKIFYCALVLKHNSDPKLINLFEESRLDSLLADESKINEMYNYRVDAIDTDDSEYNPNNGKKLYDLIWAPIEKAVGNATTVYYSPSGKLNLISFAALPDNENKVLLEKYNLRQLTSTKEILTETIKTDEVKKIALFGGIDYGSLPGFRPLPRTMEEVENIYHLLKEKNIGQVSIYTDTSANERKFKMLNGKDYDIIHIATHGFYIPQEEISKYDYYNFFDAGRNSVIIANSLWRSGLALAGANQAWTEKSIPDNEEDGILTSFEIAQMDLSQTKLVVLSACRTGLGDINGSEGVYGLQRAFKNAGVQTIIMSLWKVPDKETSIMMQLFYQYWLVEKTDKYEAFRKAQIETREKFPNVISWAGFVMID